jgi:hypothetical protein
VRTRTLPSAPEVGREERRPLLSGDEAALAVEVIHAIYRSAARGLPERLPLKGSAAGPLGVKDMRRAAASVRRLRRR